MPGCGKPLVHIYGPDLLRRACPGLGNGAYRLGPKGALLLAYLATSLFFGWLHVWNPGATLITTANLALVGLLLGLGMFLTEELAIPIGLHITWNIFQGPVFGFPVSGWDDQFSILAIQQSGPKLLTGGAFGPEGGLVGVLAVMLGMLLIWGWVRWTRGRAALREDIAIYTPYAARSHATPADQDPFLEEPTT